MSNVIPLASPRAGNHVHSSARSPATINRQPPEQDRHTLALPRHTDPLARQQAIENALSLALWYIRQDELPNNIHAATVKAVRAAAMLKQACANSTNGGRA